MASWHSEIQYGSLLAYSPRGTSQISSDSQRVCGAIKRGDAEVLALAMKRLREFLEVSGSTWCFGSDVYLVPAPRSAPLVSGALWPSAQICDALVACGFAKATLPIVDRVKPVLKSATAPRGGRPSIGEHYDSIDVRRTLESPQRMVVVDDVITRGATLLATASRVRDLYPSSAIEAFALIRTRGLVGDIDKILDPVVGGKISALSGNLERTHD